VQRTGSTRDAVYEAALDAFFEFGYAGASLRDIARRVGVEVASLYNHMKSKEDLLFRIMLNSSNQLIGMLRDAEAASENADSRHKLIAIVRALVLFHVENPRESFVGATEIQSLSAERREVAMGKQSEAEAIVKDLVKNCIADGYLPAGSPATVIAYQLIALGTTIPRWYKPNGAVSGPELGDITADLVLNGLQRRRAAGQG
jgi:AcrR family transcriptional regulator